MGRASRRKGTEAHLDKMAIKTAKRDLRRRRRIGQLVGQAQARKMAELLTEAADGPANQSQKIESR